MPASQMHPYSIFVDRDRGTVHICAQGIGHRQYFSKAALHQLFSHTEGCAAPAMDSVNLKTSAPNRACAARRRGVRGAALRPAPAACGAVDEPRENETRCNPYYQHATG